MASHREYTGEVCRFGHPMYVDVMVVPSGMETFERRDGPSCWDVTCRAHLEWRARLASDETPDR